jgi:steroid 5-alpha reductase family enzyme
MILLVLIAWLAVAVVMVGMWWRQVRTENATSVDVVWAAALGALAVFYPWFVEGDVGRRILVGALAGIWALRLGLYLYRNRVASATQEDGRYRAMREYWGASAQPKFFLFYQGQAIVAVLFSLPVLAAMAGGPLDVWSVVGVAVWGVAVVGETVAGDTPGTPTTSSNGSTGGHMWCWPTAPC